MLNVAYRGVLEPLLYKGGLRLRKLPRPHPLSESREEGRREGGEEWGAAAAGGAVLTVSHGGSPVSFHAEILERSGQLTATVDLGLAGGEQPAEQRGKGQQHAPRRAQLPSGSPAPGFHAGGGGTAPATLAHNWVLRWQAVQQPWSTTHRRLALEEKENQGLSVPVKRGEGTNTANQLPCSPEEASATPLRSEIQERAP